MDTMLSQSPRCCCYRPSSSCQKRTANSEQSWASGWNPCGIYGTSIPQHQRGGGEGGQRRGNWPLFGGLGWAFWVLNFDCSDKIQACTLTTQQSTSYFRPPSTCPGRKDPQPFAMKRVAWRTPQTELEPRDPSRFLIIERTIRQY